MGLPKPKFRIIVSATALAACALPVAAQDNPLAGWDWGAQVYFWGASIGGTASNGSDIDISIDDLLDNIKMGFMGTLEARKGHWSLFFDAIYLDVGDDGKADGNPVSFDASLDLKGFISTFGAGYQIYEDQSTKLSATGGLRFLWLDTDIEADASIGAINKSLDISKSHGNWDAVVGLRGTTDINDEWYLSYYGDIGTGDSDFTWQAGASVNYRFGKVDATFGYRYIDWEFKNKGAFDDLNLSGFYAGVKFPI